MFGKLKKFALQKGYNLARKKGVYCPECREKLILSPRMPQGGLDASICCQSCGWQGGFIDIITDKPDDRAPLITEKPASSKISYTMTAEGQTWTIPAKRRPNFFWFFSLFWLAITGTITAAFLFGDRIDADTGKVLSPWIFLFFVPFWIIGLGVLYAAISMTFGSFSIIKNRDTITLRKHLFGSHKDKTLALANIDKIGLDSAYEQNDTPVYKVKIYAKEGKDLSFGTTLSEDEKSWMVHELSELAGLEPKRSSRSLGSQLASGSVDAAELKGMKQKGFTIESTGGRNFHLSINDTISKWLLLGSLFALIIGGVFVGSEISDYNQVDNSPGIFRIISSGFSIIGLLVGGSAIVIGAAVLIFALRRWGTVKHFHFNEDELVWSVNKGDTVRKSETVPKSHFADVKVNTSGDVNDSPRYKVKLTGQKHLTLCSFVPEDDANAIAEWVIFWMNDTKNEEVIEPHAQSYGSPIELG